VGNTPCWGLVKNTGFLTTKGSLIRDILYPKEIKFKFYTDGFKFIGIMAALAIVANVATIPPQINLGVPFETQLDRALDLLTVTVPPALPAAMSCGIVFAIRRLKKQSIFCISPPRINMAGQISTFVFDKTGTLTEEGLSVMGFRPTTRGEQRTAVFSSFTQDACTLTPRVGQWWTWENSDEIRCKNETMFVEAMASCTAITYVDGELVGDPLDVQMFKATGWHFDESAQKLEDLDEVVIGFVSPAQQQPQDRVGQPSSDLIL